MATNQWTDDDDFDDDIEDSQPQVNEIGRAHV